MLDYKGLVILGCGGHARSVADVAISLGVPELLFLDRNAAEGERILGIPVDRDLDGSFPPGWLCIPAGGDNLKRREQYEMSISRHWPLATVVSPCATIGKDAVLSSGIFIGHHAHVGPRSVVGNGCIINTGAVVEHDCRVGDFTHISVNATVAGSVIVGSCCFIGAGATVIDGVCLCNDVKIGAGGVVHRSIGQAGTYVGVPAVLKK